jgi:hypothetical protein
MLTHRFRKKQNTHNKKEEVINKDIPWAYFDGALQGSLLREDSGGILYLSSNHSISFKVGIGQETNNYCELMALKLVLRMASRVWCITNSNFWSQPIHCWLSNGCTRKQLSRIFTLQPLHFFMNVVIFMGFLMIRYICNFIDIVYNYF